MSIGYTCIPHLLEIESERHLINLVIERSGAELSDRDVLRRIGQVIAAASRDFDGRVRSHMAVPVARTVTALTGTVEMSNGSTDVVGVGTLFLEELEVGSWFYADDNDDAIVIVDEIEDDENLTLTCEYYGIDVAAGSEASLVLPNVPEEVQQLVRDHAAYFLWARRGRLDENNPHHGIELQFRAKTKDVRRGDYRFVEAGGVEVSERPVKYDTETEPTMTNAAFDGFMGDW